MRQALRNDQVDKNSYLKGLELFKKDLIEESLAKLSEAQVISPGLDKIEKGKKHLEQILINIMKLVDVGDQDKNELMTKVRIDIQSDGFFIDERLGSSELLEAKRRVDEAMSVISQQLDLTKLKIEGNEGFNKAVEIEDMAAASTDDFASLENFQQAIELYKNAIKKFADGAARGDQRFEECLKICEESILRVNLAKAALEKNSQLNSVRNQTDITKTQHNLFDGLNLLVFNREKKELSKELIQLI